MAKRIGMITIGQSPRNDVTPDLLNIMGEDVEIVQRGALDGLTLDEIERMKPAGDDYTLVTRLKDGNQVMISKKTVLPLMQEKISELDREGINPILLLCTGDFPVFDAKALVVEPQKILHFGVKGLAGRQKIGVLTPAREQMSQAEIKWAASGLNAVAFFGSPYIEGDEYLEGIGELAKMDISLIVMDCMGYTIEMKERARDVTDKPVILARTFVARIMSELLE